MDCLEVSAEQALQMAKGCRQYAMCKIDFLGTGICESGADRRFVAYYPQGRMLLYAALAEGKIPVTARAKEIADGCTLCGKCDYQCYFVTGMRPTAVMRALKRFVVGHPQPDRAASDADPLLAEIRAIVGSRWADSDPAVTVTYSTDPCPLADQRIPRYVVLPESAEQVAALLALFREHGIAWTVRGNGTNILGFALGDGAIIDMNRMKRIEFDEKNWTARIGPGVTAFELQSEAVRRGYRVCVAEGAASVISSIMTSGILSLLSTAYGTCASNVVDAEFVSREGRRFSLNDKEAPNLFAFQMTDQESRFVCTSATIKLHPRSDDEAGVLVPFQGLDDAVAFARDCAVRRIGFGIGILGAEYVSSFISPTQAQAVTVKETLSTKLGMEYLVVVLGDRHALRSVADMGRPLIDQKLFRTLNLGLNALGAAEWLELLTEVSQEEPFSYLKIQGFSELAETALGPSPEALLKEVDPDLRSFYAELYAGSEMTDLVWLNMFRVTSSRIGREKHFFPILVYLPLEAELLGVLVREFAAIAAKHGIKHDLGFITPVDDGKRCMFEYDYFVDHTDPAQIADFRVAAGEVGAVIEKYAAKTGTIRWLRYLLHQGVCRMENLLYC
ncbi:FAD-binding oxidoreductase [Geomesophilobacter sediminis]|uniref:FAD-dependent oxidoreductase n=1 Tax=Geomesophilobacter sediminis TaxID=2798584 RepID=A0A8J7JMT6_9BACT|nr:FAD-dependent oxidoreductase [Geomesophilobacter sediminis]MBJ6726285.1 FAD-dependent oxidoreductase [Geomesophilobacter sediminis]